MSKTFRSKKSSPRLSLTQFEDRLAPSATVPTTLNVAAIDSSLAWADQIAQSAKPGATVTSIGDGTVDAFVAELEKLTAVSNARISHLALVAHGQPGSINLGAESWDVGSLAAVGNRLANLFAPGSFIDLYSCDVASGSGGRAFVDALAIATGANVRASDDAVGSGRLGDFDWEYNTGARVQPNLLNTQSLERIPGLALEDAYEPNNTRPEADRPTGTNSPNFGLLTSSLTINNLQLEADTSDWYRFELAGVGTIDHFVRIEFINANGDIDLHVFAPDGANLGSSGGGSDVQQVSLAGRPSGVYYIQVVNRLAGMGNPNYTLQITPPAAKADDSYEQNDTLAATNVPTGPNSPNLGVLTTATSLTNLVLEGDADWFKFEMSGVGTTNDYVRAEFINANGDLDLFVYAGNGAQIGTSGGGNNTQQVSLAGRPAGIYYVQIAPRFVHTGNTLYSLQIKPAVPGADDVYERNDVKADADAPIGPSSPNLGVVAGSRVLTNLVQTGDNDWFRFTTTEAATTSHYVRAEFINANGDLDLFVYKADGITQVGASGGGPDVQQVSMSGQPAGDYYARVVPRFDYTGNADYTLQIMAPGTGMTVNQPTLVEGNSGTTNMLFTVGRSSSTGTASFDYSTANGTAIVGEDFVASSGTISFANGETSRSFSVPIIGDIDDESDETFVVRFTNGVGLTLSTPFAIGRIIDDEITGPVELATTSIEVSEAVGSVLVRVQRTGDIGVPVSVRLQTGFGTADANDFTPVDVIVSFDAGEAEKVVPISILDDTESESAETFFVTIGNPTGGANLGAKSTATVTILDNDFRPGVFQFRSAVFSTSEADGVALITVDRLEGSSGEATVKFATVKKTARAKKDFTPTSGILTFADGETSKSFSIPLVNDSTFEPDEELKLILKSPKGGATLGDPRQAILVIENDDPLMTSTTVVAGSGNRPVINLIDGPTGKAKFSIPVYPTTFKGGVRVATGDVTGDGIPDIITGPASGAISQVKIFDGFTGTQLQGAAGTFTVFGAGFTGGITVAAADVNGDDRADIIVGTGAGIAGHIKVFDGVDYSEIHDIDVTSYMGGLSVAVADVNDDGVPDLIAGTDYSVKVFDGQTGQQFAGVMGEFTAFDSLFGPGVSVAAFDLDGDGRAEIVAGSGAGGPSEARVFDGVSRSLLFAMNPFAASFTGGVRVAVGDVNGDGILDLIHGPGTGKKQKVQAFDWGTLELVQSFHGFRGRATDGLFLAGVQ